MGEHSGKKGFWIVAIPVQYTWNCCFMSKRRVDWKSQSFAVISQAVYKTEEMEIERCRASSALTSVLKLNPESRTKKVSEKKNKRKQKKKESFWLEILLSL